MSKPSSIKQVIADGLWNNNIVLSQLLALCPLLAVTNGATNGLGLGLATTAVMVLANLITSLMKSIVSHAIRIPMNILVIALLVTITDLLLNALLPSLHQVLGLFIPLIVTNCAILGRVESFASRNGAGITVIDGLAMGVGFTWVLVLLGGIREILGTGYLFANAELLLGGQFAFLEMTVIEGYRGLLIAILPPGGFLVLSLILMVKQHSESLITGYQQRKARRNGYESQCDLRQ
ncbi:electron transport complex subunit E [Vibrio sp. WXL210]|uniref:electron transport complex subunit E n=1 Tax=Vibrio sp. WXL210 TaxID=3450709 RepID=UPI003EC83ED0